MSASELREAALDVLPATMMPDRIDLVEVLPVNKSNKLDERQLLSDAGLRPPRSSSPPTSTASPE